MKVIGVSLTNFQPVFNPLTDYPAFGLKQIIAKDETSWTTITVLEPNE